MIIRVKVNDQIFDVEIGDLSARPVVAKVGSETFEVTPEEAAGAAQVLTNPAVAPEPLAAAPVAVPVSSGAISTDTSRTVVAPIPGTIIAITARPGDSVTHGQELCVLEAMKMKNSIRATRPGKVEKIHVEVGAQVRQGQPLVSFTD
ncbi:MAG TPA: biotin/lipoyl-containing protein [Anaerolineaceae bacterium]